MLIGVGVSCCISYYSVSYFLWAVADQLHRLGKRGIVFLLLFTFNYVVSVGRGFPLLLMG